jgi:hypothetical protein
MCVFYCAQSVIQARVLKRLLSCITIQVKNHQFSLVRGFGSATALRSVGFSCNFTLYNITYDNSPMLVCGEICF